MISERVISEIRGGEEIREEERREEMRMGKQTKKEKRRQDRRKEEVRREEVRREEVRREEERREEKKRGEEESRRREEKRRGDERRILASELEKEIDTEFTTQINYDEMRFNLLLIDRTGRTYCEIRKFKIKIIGMT